MKNIFKLLFQWILSCIGVFILLMIIGKFSDETSGLILVLFIIFSFIFQVARLAKMNNIDLIGKFRANLNSASTKPVVNISDVPQKKYLGYTKLSTFTKLFLGINLFNFILFSLQYLGFMFFGVGGFIFTILARFFNPINSYLALILFITTLIFWKKSSSHILQLLPFLFYVFAGISQFIFNYYANEHGSYTFAYYGEILVQILGVLVAFIAYFKYKKIPIDAQIPQPLS